MALGGGCELVLHADAVQAYAESYIGLVEAGVGLIPGWGGCGEMLARWQAEPKLPRGPMPAPAKVFEGISTADVSKSAHQAMEKKFLRATDGITMNRDRLLADAKQRALALVDGYKPPEPPVFVLPGSSGGRGCTPRRRRSISAGSQPIMTWSWPMRWRRCCRAAIRTLSIRWTSRRCSIWNAGRSCGWSARGRLWRGSSIRLRPASRCGIRRFRDWTAPDCLGMANMETQMNADERR